MSDNYLQNGLTQEEVKARIAEGKVNRTDDETSKSVKDIFLTNIFNLFNFINCLLAVIVFITGHYRNMLFIFVVIFNTAMGIIQELKAKRKLDRLRLLNEPHADVIRNQKGMIISGDDIVLDDLMVLSIGRQILADAIILEGSIEVNESLLTGEADNITKKIGDNLFAGSFVTSGHCLAKVNHVGADNYIHKIIKNAKKEKRQPSRLRDALNFIIKCITFIIFPLGLIIFLKQYYISGIPLNDALLQTTASTLGMIPEGLVLLTTIALTVGAVNLAKNSTLIQELYSLETLARVNVLCLDKTGTITSGKMKVIDLVEYQPFDHNVLANILTATGDQNATAQALRSYFKVEKPLSIDKTFPFSSQRKYSGGLYNSDLYQIGAYNYLDIRHDPMIEQDIDDKSRQGYRILTIARNDQPVALVIIEDELRTNAKETIAYFKKQGVDLKVISGDDPKTVANICQKAGVDHSDRYVDCQKIADEELKELILTHTVFGRVSPDQKMLMIETLKQSGHTTGMVGDGVNDVMALKSADFSISMFSASDSAKNIANVVLLDDDFAHMPAIVNEGRRVINNIQRTATLFLTKTVLSIFLTVITIFILKEYPYAPVQLTMLSSLCIGLPAFVLSLEPKYEVVEGNFLANVLAKAIPSALAIIGAIMLAELLVILGLLPYEKLSTVITLISGAVMIYNIYSIARPLTITRGMLIVIAVSGIAVSFLFFKDLFYFLDLDLTELLITFTLMALEIVFVKWLMKLNLSVYFAGRIDKYY